MSTTTTEEPRVFHKIYAEITSSKSWSLRRKDNRVCVCDFV